MNLLLNPKSIQVYDFISLYEYAVIFGIFALAIAGNNMYLFFILAGALSQEIPVYALKSTIKDPRPDGASNCNIINLGTKSSENGFPSGHTTFSSFVFIYSLYECMKIQKETGKMPWGILLITGLFFILMPIARVQKGCHTVSQVLGGLVMGSLWAGLYIFLEENYFLSIDLYRQDKKRFIASLIKK